MHLSVRAIQAEAHCARRQRPDLSDPFPGEQPAVGEEDQRHTARPQPLGDGQPVGPQKEFAAHEGHFSTGQGSQLIG
jgi:hypothetical protein